MKAFPGTNCCTHSLPRRQVRSVYRLELRQRECVAEVGQAVRGLRRPLGAHADFAELPALAGPVVVREEVDLRVRADLGKQRLKRGSDH